MEFFNNKRCILFAQSDYAARLKEYLRLIAPELRLVDILMPLTTEKPDKTEFFFEVAFSACRDINSEDIILVGFSMKYHAIIKTFLQEKGYFNLVFYTSELDNELKKDYLKADLVEKIVRLTTALAVAVTLLILTVAVMFYLTLALVHWMAPVTGLAAAFGIVGLALLALLILVVLFRKAWIERPLVRVLAAILLEEDTH